GQAGRACEQAQQGEGGAEKRQGVCRVLHDHCVLGGGATGAKLSCGVQCAYYTVKARVGHRKNSGGGSVRKDNILGNLPDATAQERFEPLLEAQGVLIERITSRGQCSAPDSWYDAPRTEWVMLVK